MIKIRKVDTSSINNNDAAFIVKMLTDNKDKATDDYQIDDDKIRKVFYSPTTRIIEDDGNYIALGFLTGIEKGLSASLHGYVNGAYGYFKFKRHHCFDLVLEDYFKSLDVRSLNVWLPEYLESRAVNKKGIALKKPIKGLAAKILINAGFKRITSPIKNWSFKNGEPIDVFVYQVHRHWFNKWQRIKSEFEKTNISIDRLADKFRVNPVRLEQIAKIKNWNKKV